MAQQTSELWQKLWRSKNTAVEYAFEINGVWYSSDDEVSHSVEAGLFDELGIGNATSAKLSLSLFAESIQRGAEIRRFARLVNGSQVSEWLPKGVFFTNRRSEEDGCWSIEAFDVIRKAEVVWEPDQALIFPMSMRSAVLEFSRIMGCEIDPRTTIQADYTIDYPANDYTIRQELQFIAAANGGNWIATDEGKLLLVPLISMPEETNYLIDEHGDCITLGGVRIIVG